MIVAHEVHVLTCFGRAEIIVIPCLQAVVLRLRRSAIPGRADDARGWIQDTMVHLFEMVGGKDQKQSRKTVARGKERYVINEYYPQAVCPVLY